VRATISPCIEKRRLYTGFKPGHKLPLLHDKMLSLTGNTAPYMLYAYARCDSPPPGIEKSRVGGSP